MDPLLCFTVDTEPDNLWGDSAAITFDHFSRLFEFHRALSNRGARPTYLTTSEVVEHIGARQVMERILATGTAEVGTHFHTWTRKWPFPVADLGNPPLHAMAHQLGQETEERMLAYTCDSIRRNLGVLPVSYRGGRWSLNGSSVKSLHNCGILIDSTVVPGQNWEDGRHPLLNGPDFTESYRAVHYLAGESLVPRAAGAVLEVPVGASFLPNTKFALSSAIHVRLVRKLANAFGRPMGRLWLRPALTSRRGLQACMADLLRSKIDVWVVMIHSSEIGPNPYFPDGPKLQAFIQRCFHVVEDAISLGAKAATLKEVWQHFHAERSA